MTTIPIERTDVDQAVEVFVWPDVPIACEWGVHNAIAESRSLPTRGDCPQPAEWILWRGCCVNKLKYLLFCTEHKDYVLASPEALQCAFCGEVVQPAARFFMFIEPLNERPTG